MKSEEEIQNAIELYADMVQKNLCSAYEAAGRCRGCVPDSLSEVCAE